MANDEWILTGSFNIRHSTFKSERKDRYVCHAIWRIGNSLFVVFDSVEFVVDGILDLDADRCGAESWAGSERADCVGYCRGSAAFSRGIDLLFCGETETQAGAGGLTR